MSQEPVQRKGETFEERASREAQRIALIVTGGLQAFVQSQAGGHPDGAAVLVLKARTGVIRCCGTETAAVATPSTRRDSTPALTEAVFDRAVARVESFCREAGYIAVRSDDWAEGPWLSSDPDTESIVPALRVKGV